MVLLFIIVVAIIIIAAKSRAKKERVVKHTLEETIQITRNHLIKDVIFLVIGIVLLVKGIQRYNDSYLFCELDGISEALFGGIIGLVYLIAGLSNLSKLGEYNNMNQIQYKQHQENMSQRIKKEDEDGQKALQESQKVAQRWIFWQNIKRLNGW